MHVELTKLLAHLVYIARRPNVTLLIFAVMLSIVLYNPCLGPRTVPEAVCGRGGKNPSDEVLT